MPECLVCGCTDFGEPQDGLYFCPECGTQSQDVRVEVSNLEESGYIRSLRQKKERKKKDRSRDSDDDTHILHTFQGIIKQQCDALISLGFDPSVKEAARLIWFTYLRHFGYAFRDQPLPGKRVRSIKRLRAANTPPVQTRDQVSEASSPGQVSGSTSSTRGIIQVVETDSRRRIARRAYRAKALKGDNGVKAAGYDSFPTDDFLFEDVKEEDEESKNGSVSGNSTLSIENISSWEELEAIESSMDYRQLYAFRNAYVSKRKKPKFLTQDECWHIQKVMVVRQATTLGVLYLALLYTEQKLLPVDITRWVRMEKIPYSTPLNDSCSVSKTKVQYTGLLTTQQVLTSAEKLCECLPLPPLPLLNPHTICHIIMERLRLTACFQDLVDKAIDRVYYPTSFKNRRMDAQCVSVIIMMLRVLYGLNDKLEIEHSLYCRAAQTGEEEEEEERTSANSLYLWEDWVQVYCDHLNETMEEGIPLSSQEFSKVKNYQTYFQFCKDTIFTRSRPIPVTLNSHRSLDPAFSAKVSQIFRDHNQQEKWKTGNTSTDPPPNTEPHTVNKDTRSAPRLIPLSSFMDGPMVACTAYRPLPASQAVRNDKVFDQLSSSMQFLLSVCSELIDIPLLDLYTVLLVVETSFLKGTFECLNNIAKIVCLEIK